MRRDPLTGIAVLDATIDFRDSSEQQILTVLENASDRSSLSDELARHITDWPTRYHFSRCRGHLLRPLEIRPGIRVLDVGAGTGAIARSLAERGAHVVALEGNLDRARAAATRCADLDGVEVICGDFGSFQDDAGFDLVCFIGVLEYASSAVGGGQGAAAALRRARSLLRPDGAMVIAIENQIGLKYLLGYPEDHLGEPFAGVEGYLGGVGVRTWSRRGLAQLLADEGLAHQSWLYPYPDYKLPTAVLSSRAFAAPDAVDLVDALVRTPTTDDAGAPPTACDARTAHRVFLAAGLGPEVANSFLVVASHDAATPARVVPPDRIAWFFGHERLRSWMRFHVVSEDDGARTIRTVPADPKVVARQRGWLRQINDSESRFHVGPTVEQLALAACHAHDLEKLRENLGTWRSYLESQTSSDSKGGSAVHPFLPDAAGRRLLPDHLDVSLSNLVVAEDGLVMVDREWTAGSGVDPLLAALRALWYLAIDLVAHRKDHPFNPEATVDELALALATTAGIDADDDDLARLHAAEAILQAKVSGRPRKQIVDEIEWLSRLDPLSESIVRNLPFTRLRRDLLRVTERAEARAQAQIDRLEEQATDLRRHNERLTSELDQCHSSHQEAARSIDRLHGEVSYHAGDAERQRATRIQLEQVVSTQNAIHDGLRSQLDELRHRIESAARQSDTDRVRLQSELEAAGERLHQAEQHGHQLAADRDRLQRELEAADERLRQAEQHGHQLAADRDRLQSELVAAGERLRQTEQRGHQMAADRDRLQRELVAAGERLRQTEQRGHQMAADRDLFERQRDDLGEQSDRLQAELNEAIQSSRQLEERLTSYRADHAATTATLQRDADDARATIERARFAWQTESSRAASFEVQVHELESRLTRSHQHVAELEATRNQLESMRLELEGELGHWRQWRAAFERRLPVRGYHLLRRMLGPNRK